MRAFLAVARGSCARPCSWSAATAAPSPARRLCCSLLRASPSTGQLLYCITHVRAMRAFWRWRAAPAPARVRECSYRGANPARRLCCSLLRASPSTGQLLYCITHVRTQCARSWRWRAAPAPRPCSWSAATAAPSQRAACARCWGVTFDRSVTVCITHVRASCARSWRWRAAPAPARVRGVQLPRQASAPPVLLAAKGVPSTGQLLYCITHVRTAHLRAFWRWRAAPAPARVRRCSYRGAKPSAPPVLLAAKGVTFDSGGLCLKECHTMTENRGSMAGAAVVFAALKIIAKLKVPINVQAVVPICENMVSGQCMKVGDVVKALNGLSIQIEHTDMEGRLMMADALVYGQALYKPALVIDVATFTQGVLMATGGGAFGVFSNSERAWKAVRGAGAYTGDRAWRFPLWQYFQHQITNDPSVDLRNKGAGRATPCLGAAFLRNFVCSEWVHMDITGVGKVAHLGPPYLHPRRMAGRPARTLAALLRALANKDCPPPAQPASPCTTS
ncbi:unnamed protein product [Chrysodeixis includens]|uniref:Cytosol aminopeptidase domain-containing protein n=1 Tax=Chrysodeixis includens TaxID=689277 RepID=A0A9N8Q1J3_CHRIL|nr:unnamed protein product [Chrysodeixis includens]